MKQKKPPQYYTYIVKCSDSSFYIGKTKNLLKRLKQHNGELSGGSKYTRARRPVYLCYYEIHANNKQACEREAFLKTLSHGEKEELIRTQTVLSFK